MKLNQTTDFFYQLFTLIAAVIIVHALYVAVVRPNADALLEEQRMQQEAGEGYEVQRSVFIVIKDFEQEACFILALWVVAIIGLKARVALAERRLLGRSLLELPPGATILPEDTRQYVRPLQALTADEREYLLPRALQAALQRFGSTADIQGVSSAIREVCETESDRLDSELSMIRYIIWAIPSIGFIGTVRGIGEALGQAPPRGGRRHRGGHRQPGGGLQLHLHRLDHQYFHHVPDAPVTVAAGTTGAGHAALLRRQPVAPLAGEIGGVQGGNQQNHTAHRKIVIVAFSKEKIMTQENELLERITMRSDVFGGKPIIRDVRIAVEHIPANLATGETVEDLLKDYPFLELEDIQACFLFAHRSLAGEHVHDRIAVSKAS